MLWSRDLALDEVHDQCDLVVELSQLQISRKTQLSRDMPLETWFSAEPPAQPIRSSSTVDTSLLMQKLATEGFLTYEGEFVLTRPDNAIIVALTVDAITGKLMPQTCSLYSIIDAKTGTSLHRTHVHNSVACPNFGPIRGGLPMWVQTIPVGARSGQLLHAMYTWNRARLRSNTDGTICGPFICYHYSGVWANLGPYSLRYPELITLGNTDTTPRPAHHPEGDNYRIRFNSLVNWNHRDNDPSGDEFDLESVALHECGHALGLDHSGNSSDVMFPSLSPGVKKRILTQRDIDCAKSIYGL